MYELEQYVLGDEFRSAEEKAEMLLALGKYHDTCALLYRKHRDEEYEDEMVRVERLVKSFITDRYVREVLELSGRDAELIGNALDESGSPMIDRYLSTIREIDDEAARNEAAEQSEMRRTHRWIESQAGLPHKVIRIK